jgi:ABC-type sugar transport system substrate-binding protein
LKLNRSIKVAFVAVAASSLVIAGTTTSTAAKKLSSIRIAAVVKGLDNPFFIGIKEGIEEMYKLLLV